MGKAEVTITINRSAKRQFEGDLATLKELMEAHAL